jgi:tight adherence protein C
MTPAVAMAAVAGVLAAAAIVGLAEERRGARGRRRGGGARAVALAVRLSRPLARGLGQRDVGARLAAAGTPLDLTVSDVVALEAGGALAGALLALPGSSLAPGRLGVVLLLAAPVAGFLAPGLLLERRARRRRARIERELADAGELLRVAVDAGLPPMRALGEVGRRHPGVLAGELRRAEQQTLLGVPQDVALAALLRAAPAPGVAQLTTALTRAARHGAPLGPVLHAIAADARAQRARLIRERAARAAPKVQLVVALLLVPAVLLLVAAALATALGGGS